MPLRVAAIRAFSAKPAFANTVSSTLASSSSGDTCRNMSTMSCCERATSTPAATSTHAIQAHLASEEITLGKVGTQRRFQERQDRPRSACLHVRQGSHDLLAHFRTGLKHVRDGSLEF